MILLFLKIELFLLFILPGIGENSRIFISTLSIGNVSTYNVFEKKLVKVLKDTQKRTSLIISDKISKTEPGDMPVHPFIVIHVSELPPLEMRLKIRTMFKKFVHKQGFAWIINGADANKRFAVDSWIRKLVASGFENKSLAGLKQSSIVYRSFYDLSGEKDLMINEGIYDQDNILLLYTPFALRNLSERLEEFMINVIEYAVCSDYKNEQTHLEYILKKRRWKIDNPK